MPRPSDSTPDFSWIGEQLPSESGLAAGVTEPGKDTAAAPTAGESSSRAARSGEGAEDSTSPASNDPAEEDANVFHGARPDTPPENIEDREASLASDSSVFSDDDPDSPTFLKTGTDVLFHDREPDEEWRSDVYLPSGKGSADQNDDPATGKLPADVSSAAKSPGIPEGVQASGPQAPSSQPTSLVAGTPLAPPSGSLSRIILISYASAMTLLCLFLLMQLRQKYQPHQLESLPDIPPLREGEAQYYPPDASLPPGHVLSLGESRRFGHILVEPLRVTREPIEFVHWTGDMEEVRPPSTDDSLRLWIRLTNLSQDQRIAPLDGRLILQRRYRRDQMLANNFLRPRNSLDLVLMYDLPPSSEWELKDQDMGRVLEPQESWETYLATETDHLVELLLSEAQNETGGYIWRLHLRKGYGPTGNGVTTLIEVAFDSREIQSES